MRTAYIAFGSNLGDRRGHIELALAALAETPGVCLGRRSSLYETAPVGGPAGQGPYLNGVAAVDTDLSPEELLEAEVLIYLRGLGFPTDRRPEAKPPGPPPVPPAGGPWGTPK